MRPFIFPMSTFHNLRSSLSQWFFGSTGREDTSQLSVCERLLIFLVLLVLLYGPVWLVFDIVAPYYRSVIAVGLSQFYSQQDSPFEFESRSPVLVFRSKDRPAFEADLSSVSLDSNMVFLLTLILVTPGMRPANRVARLLLGSFFLYFTHIAFIVTKVEVSLIAAGHPLAGNPVAWHTIDNLFEITGKVSFPVGIWLLLGLHYMLGKTDRPMATVQKKVGRNHPCPCGSGEKYKYCCGP